VRLLSAADKKRRLLDAIHMGAFFGNSFQKTQVARTRALAGMATVAAAHFVHYGQIAQVA